MYHSRCYNTHKQHYAVHFPSRVVQKKLLLLVQNVVWVQVQDVTLYLTCITKMQPFYRKLQFMLNGVSNIAECITNKLHTEKIELGNDMHLMRSSNCMLITAPWTPAEITTKYVSKLKKNTMKVMDVDKSYFFNDV